MINVRKCKIFFEYFKPHKKLVYLDFTCAILSSLITISFPLVIDFALNNYLPNNKFREFLILMVIVLFAYLVNTVLIFIVGYYGHTLGVRIEADVRRDLFNHLQKLPSRFYDENRVGSLMARVTSDLFELTEFAHHGPEDAIVCIITVLGSVGAMFYLNWRLALCTALILPIAVIFIVSQEKEAIKCAENTKENLGEIHAELETSISGIKVTKAFANEEYEKKRFEKCNDKFKTAKREFFKRNGIYSSGMDLIKNYLKLSIILIGGLLYIKGYATFANIITFNLFVMVLLIPIQKLVDFAEIFLGGVSGFNRFIEIMEEEPEIKDAPNAKNMDKFRDKIEFKNVCFSYEENKEILHNINLEIKKGSTVAIIGPSGAGKTSICQLLPRFYNINSGEILIDGVNIKDITLNSLRTNIGLVQQDVFIFTDTIMENIKYGCSSKSEADIIKAAKMAEIHKDIIKMENGYHTYVGEKGAMLSGGQKQRLSLARMFLKDSPIIILDEATSALDSVTEFKIQNAIDKLSKDRTMIVIAHRLSTIRNADVIVVVDNGQIIEMGNHDELIKLKGHYYQFHKVQYKKGV